MKDVYVLYATLRQYKLADKLIRLGALFVNLFQDKYRREPKVVQVSDVDVHSHYYSLYTRV